MPATNRALWKYGSQGALSAFNITDLEITFANNLTFEFVTLCRGDSIVVLNGS